MAPMVPTGRSGQAECPGPDLMARHDLERLVTDAEADADLGELLRRCRSPEDLVLAARQLGYRITGLDLRRARQEHRRERKTPQQGDAKLRC